MKTIDTKGCHFLECFSGFPVTAAFSDRTFDLRFAEDLSVTTKDRQEFCAKAAVPAEDLVCFEQIHGSNILMINSEMRGRGAERRENAVARADGAVMKEKNIPVGIQTADCAPVFFYDPRNHTAGIAHVGWRGLYGALPEKMVQAFTNNFLSKASDLLVALGPMIRQCCYEIGGDVASHFEPFVEETKGKWHLDMAGGIISMLTQAGVKKTNIEDTELCTYCHHETFFSYRREKEQAGRLLSVMMLR